MYNKKTLITRIATASLAVVLMAASLAPQTAVAIRGWGYSRNNECEDSNSDTSGATAASSAIQVAPGNAGDWTTPGTERYQYAQTVFNVLTQQYGFSGAAAAGVMGNIAGESGFIPTRGEQGGKGNSDFEMNSKTPGPAFNYGDAGGGGGLFQETPYTRYTNSEFWSKPNSTNGGGWYIENQIAFMWDYSFALGNKSGGFIYFEKWRASHLYGVSAPFNTVEEFLSTNDPVAACQAFQAGYEGPAKYHTERYAWSQTAYALFGGASVQGDPSKWNFYKSGGATGGASLNVTASSSSLSSDSDDGECEGEEEQKTMVGVDAWIDRAKTLAADPAIGYSQQTRYKNPNLDCSSFVWHALTESGISGVTADKLGGAEFATGSMDSILSGAGFVRHDFDGNYDSVPKGSIMLRHGHTELYMGKLDENGNESPTGKPYAIGAHNDRDGQNGDGPQKSRNANPGWFNPQGGDEVSAVPASTNWEWYYTPDNVAGMNEGIAGAAILNVAPGTQTNIVRAAASTPSPGAKHCAAWVSNVYANAGLPRPGGDACDMARGWCTSHDLSQLKPGMAVAIARHNGSSAGATYGHVGIYIGNGKIMDNIGYIRTMSVYDWINYYNAHALEGQVGWGYPRGVSA